MTFQAMSNYKEQAYPETGVWRGGPKSTYLAYVPVQFDMELRTLYHN